MARWMVELLGNEDDLQTLSDWFGSSDLSIIRDKDHFYLHSSDFDSLVKPEDVLSRATELAATMDGIRKAESNQRQPTLVASAVERVNDDGTVSHFELLSSRVTFRGTPATPWQTSDAQPTLALAAMDRDVQDALYFLAQETTWWTLRKVYEIIASDFKQPNRAEKMGWAKEVDLKRFIRSANDSGVSGRGAVHALPESKPFPYPPMSLANAETFIGNLLQTWIRWKLKYSGSGSTTS